jgi:hypothetical protein
MGTKNTLVIFSGFRNIIRNVTDWTVAASAVCDKSASTAGPSTTAPTATAAEKEQNSTARTVKVIFYAVVFPMKLK